jgi:pseudaminic acid biosynthesis-associated methylase
MNEQEKFWCGKFGKNYTSRSPNYKFNLNNYYLFKKIFKNKNKTVKSILELGANNGSNLVALKKLFLKSSCTAVEINKLACINLRTLGFVNVINQSITDYKSIKKFDLVLLKGVLIHISPNRLKHLYKKISKLSKKYVLIAEYFNPFPVKVTYRGYKNKLFKRDFAFEFIKINKHYKIIDYGFVYHMDKYPQDNINWFLLKRINLKN